MDNDTSAETAALRLALRLNCAACDVKLGQWGDAASQCSEALKLDKDNAKALFRRGTARSHMGELDEARADLVAACRLAPADKSIREE